MPAQLTTLFLRHKIALLTATGIILVAAAVGLGRFTLLSYLPTIPLEAWADALVTWLNDNLEVVFEAISAVILVVLDPLLFFFTSTPAFSVVILIAGLGYLLGGWRLALFVGAALTFVSMIGFFEEMMHTLALALTATIFSLLVGIPVGILKAHVHVLDVALDPVLDLMQTMPLFVHLIPAVLFFGIGNVPGIIATFIFATPPAVRLTALGIQQIPSELVEAGRAFGATRTQFLIKIELPLALPSIVAGVNQTIMLALSMVVV
ncbi:ABC transporter permease subunit, partial [Patescibacteria group bacterium]|nr:ABC transporter permease subunit [Patescibacteria group bacterium]